MPTFYNSTNGNLVERKKRVKMANISTFLVDNNRVYSVILDMNSTDVMGTSFKFKQYDYGTCFLHAQLMDGEDSLNISNKTVIGVFRDSNGKIFLDNNNKPLTTKARGVLPVDGVVKIPVPKDVLKSVGSVDCEIMIFDSKVNRMTSPRFSFSIQESLCEYDFVPPVNKVPITGEVVCGESICGGDEAHEIESQYVCESFLSNDFLEHFGGGANGL